MCCTTCPTSYTDWEQRQQIEHAVEIVDAMVDPDYDDVLAAAQIARGATT